MEEEKRDFIMRRNQSVGEEKEEIGSVLESNRYPSHLSEGREGGLEPGDAGEAYVEWPEEAAVESEGEEKGDYAGTVDRGSRKTVDGGSTWSVEYHYEGSNQGWAGVLFTRPGLNEEERFRDLAARLCERVLGQDQAVEAVLGAISRSRADRGRSQQPFGSFLFLGPHGVGKTELAKALAEQLSGDENLLVRIDMSEHTERHSVVRLIGGSGEYEEGGQLTKDVRRRPYSVVLFKDVEKAHVDVINKLHRVLVDGRLTDDGKRTVDFTKTVIVMTSNLGAEHLLSVDLLSRKQVAHERVRQEVTRHFRSELLEQLDDIVIFDPLCQDVLKRVAKLHMDGLPARLADGSLNLLVADETLEWVVAKSYDHASGARSVKKWLEGNVFTELSRKMRRGEINGNSIVCIDVGVDGLVYDLKDDENKTVD